MVNIDMHQYLMRLLLNSLKYLQMLKNSYFRYFCKLSFLLFQNYFLPVLLLIGCNAFGSSKDSHDEIAEKLEFFDTKLNFMENNQI